MVRDIVSGRLERDFSLPVGVTREVYLLDRDATVAATQRDLTIFWDLASGREIRRLDRRAYAFNHAMTQFLSFVPGEGTTLMSYPQLTTIHRLTIGPSIGPEAIQFSPDDRFLVVMFAAGRPESDTSFPNADPVRRGSRYARLFDLRDGRLVESFSTLDIKRLAGFSEDSRFYYAVGHPGRPGQAGVAGWRFDLTTAEWGPSTAGDAP